MVKRRNILSWGLKAGAGAGLLGTGILGAPAIVLAEHRRPQAVSGVMSGDVLSDRAVLWSQADRAAFMHVEIADNPAFKQARRLPRLGLLPETGLAGKLDATGLRGWDHLYYRVWFESPGDHRALSEPVTGTLPLAPTRARDIRLVWSGDVVGQGWGIDEARGGMTIYDAMLKVNPDFFIHSGDTVYADGPLEERVMLDDGSVWNNLMTPAKRKVAETLDEYRGQHAYNLKDRNVRAFNAAVPMLAQWDDHETLNNWYPQEVLADDRYSEKNVALLSQRARRAFLEFTPTRMAPDAPQRIYRKFPYGPGMEVFMLDMRTYRGPNSTNLQPDASPATAFLGETQFDWLKRALTASTATWKIIAADMPIGLLVPDGDSGDFEAIANGDPGRPLGRELEMARLLTFIRDNHIRNVVWLTADVHYTAAHHYSPERAAFKEFAPFWEFVSGPLHAGTFGPGSLDNTFGPQVMFQKAPPEGQKNLPPSRGYQFFGQVDLEGESNVLTVTLKDSAGTRLYQQALTPEYA
ncbi:alkaline phosphatase D family protein [Larsenimonas rhizosphaerae]|uniref:Alkaline phosphatase D family protein n=1 Tax=Larsenimonas rhizosphaerae TaxID=2944682 RepID=A0AA42CXR5_9GAMM|nr:alkaline phosphatase D family protein [Larsenimonas rhizosphaerae]MCM2129527.1 alkaline phosphatase D family protein [Larsenimonas rhizosphaerae]MCX2524183.1 alkaline phosphatase D family protein [Larsenimonas rhizosphaerae]